MIFSKTLTETLLLKKSKNPANDPETWYVNEMFFLMLTYYISFKWS